MGGTTFSQYGNGPSAREAFQNAVTQARYENGNAGFTGSLAEKYDFVMFIPPPGVDPIGFAHDLVENSDPRISDKWGPAGCVKTGPDTYLFFGWASS